MWWLCLMDAIPTRDRLSRLFPVEDMRCPLCDSDQETPVHLFFYCPFAAHIWLRSRWSLITNSKPGKSYFQWFLDLWEYEKRLRIKDALICFAGCVMDVVWSTRNEVTHGAQRPSFDSVANRVSKLFRIALSSACIIAPVPRPVWCSPPEGWIKVNFDAAVSPACSMAAVVARSWDGSVLAWRTKLLLSSSPLFAEAQSCLLAVQMANDFGWKYCIFEGDALVVIEACRNPVSFPWEIYHVISDVSFFSSCFLAWEFMFVKREANLLAHFLAAKASCCFSRGMSFHFPVWPFRLV
ncbi:hypothetical protein UlMin_032338 [Ulmus minor]